ncbi:MAG: tetraacyldisaccharide 4'-kinase [Leptospirillia bacterium]
MNLEALSRKIWAQPTGAAEVLLWPLSIASGLFRGVVAARAALYRGGLLRRVSLPVPVISVGNLRVGGTGKTPTVMHLARAISGMHREVGVVLRGYGGKHEGNNRPLLVSDGKNMLAGPDDAGDEAVLLAGSLPGVPVVVCSNRAAAGSLLCEHGVRVLLLDDGFQHLRLVRDVDVVLLDGNAPFGNGRMLPRGPLREPPDALRRADLILVRGDAEQCVRVKDRIAPLTSASVLGVEVSVAGLSDQNGRDTVLPDGINAYAVCGIARPDRFHDTLSGLPLRVVGFYPLGDHHRYSREDVRRVQEKAVAAGAEVVLTTEKDRVKLANLWEGSLPLVAVRIDLGVPDTDGHGGDLWVDRLLSLADQRCAKRKSNT